MTSIEPKLWLSKQDDKTMMSSSRIGRPETFMQVFFWAAKRVSEAQVDIKKG